MDSTTSELMQDNSNELIFGQKHNDIDCALCPTARRACDRAWVTAKQIENWSGMTKGTLRNRLIELEECERISRGQDFNHVDIPTETGAVKTTIYNMNVLNQLAMVEMKNKVLNDTAKKFSDILSEVETTGSYSIRKPDSYMIEDKIERAKRWIEETEAYPSMLGCSQSPRDVTTANLLKRKLVKNVVGLQKSDQELRVSYKPTAFRRWVVDLVVLFCGITVFGGYGSFLTFCNAVEIDYASHS